MSVRSFLKSCLERQHSQIASNRQADKVLPNKFTNVNFGLIHLIDSLQMAGLPYSSLAMQFCVSTMYEPLKVIVSHFLQEHRWKLWIVFSKLSAFRLFQYICLQYQLSNVQVYHYYKETLDPNSILIFYLCNTNFMGLHKIISTV